MIYAAKSLVRNNQPDQSAEQRYTMQAKYTAWVTLSQLIICSYTGKFKGAAPPGRF